MKLLKKMLLINWHYIEHECIHFENINFMTGKNAAGKSTILDALQLVLLGDTRGAFFNKAANDRGGRTLDGYLKGETGDDGDVGFRSIRKGRFTSYIAVEFWDTVAKKEITFGVVFDSYQDAPTDHMFFRVNDKIPEGHFIDENDRPMDYKRLKSYFARKYKLGQFETFKETNKSYQTDLLAKLGAIKPKFFNLFKKAVTFTPIDDIEKFISEYVCDVTSNIDIYQMQENIRQYKMLEKQANVMQERQVMLEGIEKNYLSYLEDVAKEQTQNYLIKRSSLQMTLDSLDSYTKQIEKSVNLIQSLKEEQEQIEQELVEHRKEQEKLKEEKISSDLYQKQQLLEKQIQELDLKLVDIHGKVQKILGRFRVRALAWRVNLEQLLAAKNKIEDTIDQEIFFVAQALKDNIEYLIQINAEELSSVRQEILEEIKLQMNTIKEVASSTYFGRKEEQTENMQKEKELQMELENLKQGVKPYKEKLLQFRELLTRKLEEVFQEKVEVSILADLLEIKDVAWQQAICCYLNHQMFYFIIDPNYYEQASKIYQEIAKEYNFYGFGIIDIAKIEQEGVKIKENSLAEEILTQSPLARTYIDYLLGKVTKCEKVTDLRKYNTAIIKDGMLYKGYVLRKLQDKSQEFNFIGKKSIEEQIAIKMQKQEELIKRKEQLAIIIEIVDALRKQESYTDNEIIDIFAEIEIVKNKEKIQLEKQQKEEEFKKIDLSWIHTLEQKITILDNTIKQQEFQKGKKHDEEIKQASYIENIKQDKIPQLEKEAEKKQEEIRESFDYGWIQAQAEERFQKELASKKPYNIYENFSNQIIRTRNLRDVKRNTVIKVREEYNRTYQLSYDITNVDNNTEYTEELVKLRDIELPNYMEMIKDSEQKAYEQFREDFLAKLKFNIDEVKLQIEELNEALKNSTFGVDSYHFNVTPKQEYRKLYDMITDPMLMEGLNILSESFNSKYAEEISELFKRITSTSSDSLDESYEKNIKLYTDYKTYLNFDLAVTDRTGNVQHLSKTLNKKSGGETQTPFYISILASFAQLYRINKGRNDNTIRLIVFDEAFSKMDEERITESIKLLRKFGFQAIISAPSEKAAEIIPLVDNTLCVIRKDKNTFIKEYAKEHKL